MSGIEDNVAYHNQNPFPSLTTAFWENNKTVQKNKNVIQ